jgi:cell division protein FtsQ
MKTKNVVLGVIATILVVGTLVVGAWASKQPSKRTCKYLEIQLTDSLERRFVSVEEMRNLVRSSGLNPVGETMADVSCHAIEQCLEGHDMIRDAQCYKLPNGGIRIRLQQRVPMFLVVSNDGSFYVDTDRKVMPVRSTIDVAVPIVKGTISKRAAVEEYYDFTAWLTKHDYWRTRIEHVQVHNPKYLVLSQNNMTATIVLGELKGYKRKLNKLQKLYTKGFDQMGYKPYKEYDLRFEGQVVGRY